MTNATHPVVAELNSDGDRINVTFDYAPQRVKLAKGVSGYKFVPREKGGPRWTYPLDIVTGRRLREAFGDELGLGPKLRAWGNREVTKATKLATLSDNDDADLTSENLKKLVDGTEHYGGDNGFKLRPYQKADIKFMTEGKSVIVANQPRTGKTITTVGAILESGFEWGWHLVFAPVASLQTIWEDQIKGTYQMAGLDEPVVLTGATPAERVEAIAEAKRMADAGEAFYLVLNPYHARLKRVMQLDGKDVTKAEFKELKPFDQDRITFEERLVSPELGEISWDSITIDEYHLMGLSNPLTLGAKGVNDIAETTQPELRFALSGTPMGGKPIKLWGALHFLNPGEFTSRWNWAKHWLVVTKEQHPGGDHNVVEGIMPGREVDFYDHLKPYLVRRTQKESLPGLPDTNRVNVWCQMTPKQAEQYRVFETDAEWRLADAEEEGRLTANNILVEYLRLKQFADAYSDVLKTGKITQDGLDQLEVRQTRDSGKLIQLIEKLKEENVIVKSEDDDDPECALVSSQFNNMVRMVRDALKDEGVPVEIIGEFGVKGPKRNAVVKAFQTQQPVEFRSQMIQPPRVLLMNTLAGTALTLDRAKSVHILDETWNPDNEEQMENRATPTTEEAMKRGVGVYYYRTRNTIEEYIRKLAAGKAMTNRTILDLRRRMQRDAEKRQAENAASDGEQMLNAE